jgi:hypothetical protein
MMMVHGKQTFSEHYLLNGNPGEDDRIGAGIDDVDNDNIV